MRRGSRTNELSDRTKAGRARIQPWRPRLRAVGAGTQRFFGWMGKAAASMRWLLVISTGCMPDHPAEHALAAAAYAAPTTTASLLKTPVGRGIVVEGVAVTEDEILWLARTIFSETKRPHEQELVAWVVRNRVETGYRGNATYEAAVLDVISSAPSIRTRRRARST